jgi:hypothetical protein
MSESGGPAPDSGAVASEPGWASNAVRVGRFEFWRSVRGLRESTGRFVLTVLGTLFPTAMFLLLGALLVGSVSVDSVPVSDAARGGVAMFWSFVVFLVAQRVVSTRPRPEAESLLLTAASTRSVVLGLALAETLRVLSYATPPVLVVTALSAYALGSFALLVVVPLVVLLAVLSAVVAGSLVGYGVALLLATSPFVARHKTALGVPVVIVAMGAFFAFQAPELVGLDRAAFAWLPMGWFADLTGVATPVTGSPPRAAGAFVGAVGVLVVGGALLEREASALWFEAAVDPSAAGDDAASASAPSPGAVTGGSDGGSSAWSGLSAAVSPFAFPARVDLPTRRVAEMTLLRARRDPRRLTFLLTPLFVFAGTLAGTGSLSSVLSTLPLLCAAFLPWGLGAATTLNPLGDEGNVLPITLVAATPRQFVRGVLLPGVVYGAPIAAALTGVAAVAGGRALLVAAGLAVSAGFVTLVAAPAGAAVGVALPRFSAVSVGRSGDVLPPRTLAVLVHGLVVVVPSGLLALLVAAPAPASGVVAAVSGVTGVPPATFRASVVSLLVLAGVLVALTGYRTAIHRVRSYEPT